MQTISQVAQLTGISTRTLQYYDEIGLLKPGGFTPSGYRLYDDDSLQKLQQILFFKELGFKLNEIKEILQKPDFDKIAAFRKQKELLLLKRNRTERLIQLLSRLEKGEECMSFKEFDLSDYIEALESFKSKNTDDIIKHWGSIKNFEFFIKKIKDDESRVAELAIKEFGSIEKYTEAMKYNLEHFSGIMEKQLADMPEGALLIDTFYKQLTADTKKEVSSADIQQIVRKIIMQMQENGTVELTDENCLQTIIDVYSSEYIKRIADAKYGVGASDYIVRAFGYYLENSLQGRA